MPRPVEGNGSEPESETSSARPSRDWDQWITRGARVVCVVIIGWQGFAEDTDRVGLLGACVSVILGSFVWDKGRELFGRGR